MRFAADAVKPNLPLVATETWFCAASSEAGVTRCRVICCKTYFYGAVPDFYGNMEVFQV